MSYNHLGSLKAVTTPKGHKVKTIEYDTFGQIISDTNTSLHVNLGFAGGLYDNDTKLTRFGYRDYDAQTGKWTAKDPIGFAGGDTNLYGYVLGDPVNFVDVMGLRGLLGEGVAVSTEAALASGPMAIPAAMEAFGLNDAIDDSLENLQNLLQNNKHNFMENGCYP